MCIKVEKEPKMIMGIILFASFIVCVPFIGVDCALWFGEVSVEELVCAIIPADLFTLDQTVARCIQVDLWSEVALVAFLIVMAIITGLLNKKNGLRALNVTSVLAIPFCLYLIGWYFYCFYVVANTLSVFESLGFDCGRLTPYMISLGVIGIITKIILIILLSMRPA
jgi:hypothetical protein